MRAPLASLPPRAADLADRILERNPMHRGFLERAVAQLSLDEASRLERYLAFADAQGLAPDHLAECYLTVVGDALREQVFFRRHGRYRYSRFAEVAARVYDDPEFMHRYMYGLAMTVFLWPNHLAMARFFERTMPRARGGACMPMCRLPTFHSLAGPSGRPAGRAGRSPTGRRFSPGPRMRRNGFRRRVPRGRWWSSTAKALQSGRRG